MPKLKTKIILLLAFTIFLCACSTTSKVPQGDYLLTKNEFKFEGKEKPHLSKLPYRVKPKPNTRLLNLMPLGLIIYNWSPQKFDKTFQEYASLTKKNRNRANLDSLLIKNGLENYAGKSLWLNRFIFNSGQEPVLVDSSAAEFSETNLQNFYKDKGYLDATVKAEHSYDTDKKKGKIIYNINPGEVSIINTYNYDIENEEIKNTYAQMYPKSHIKVSDEFDLDNFEDESNKITAVLKNKGYWKFNQSGTDLYFESDTTQSDKIMDVTLFINDNDSDSLNYGFNKYYFKNITIYPDTKSNRNENENITYYDTIYNGYLLRYQDKKMKLNPKYFTDAVVIEPNTLYKYDDEIQTKRNLFKRDNVNLGAFNLTAGKLKQDSLIDVNIYFTPLPKYDIKPSVEFLWSQFMNFGISPSLTFVWRNLFGGGENFETTFKGTLGTVDKSVAGKSGFLNAYEISLQSALKFPYLLAPFNTDKIFPKRFSKESKIRLGASTQRNIGLGRTTYNTGVDYSVSYKESHNHQLNLLNIEFVNNLNKDKYYSVYESDNIIKTDFFNIYFDFNPTIEQQYFNNELTDDQLSKYISEDWDFINSLNDNQIEDYVRYQNMLFKKASITQNVLISSILYQYTYDQSKQTRVKNPWNIRGRIELAGNILSALDKAIGFNKVTTEYGEEASSVLDVPYSQFVKVDLDVRKYWNLGEKSTIATRFFTGIAKPYGNLKFIPFIRSYSAGGANDIRAWAPATLGPAGIPRYNSGDEVFAIEHMKLLLSAEYRFNMMGLIDGAFFVDAGNIWGVDKDNELSLFKFSEFYKQLGIGSGFGFRFDFTYLILRLDLAYKIHDPAYQEGKRWQFNNFNILKPRLALGLNYPF